MFPDKFSISSIERIVYVSAEEYKEKTTKFSHRFTQNELIYHLSGEATVFFNGKVLQTRKGHIRFLPQGEVTEYIVDRQVHGECIDIVFRTDVPLCTEAIILKPEENKDIEAMFRKAFSVWSAKGDGYYLKCMALIYNIIAEIQQQSYYPKNNLAKIEPAVKYISENYTSSEINIPYLAFLSGISESYMKRLFLKKYGITPKKYITKLRLEYAVELLSSNMFSIGRIAEMTGYDNVYYFSKVFKENMGVSPGEYAAKCKSSK